MSTPKLSADEARRLLTMMKRSLVSDIDFPLRGESTEFDVMGENKEDVFSIKIYRGKIRMHKYNIGARITKNGIMLLELHMNPTTVHVNPDGEKIIGSHWHMYTEEYGRTQAFPAEDVHTADFVENTLTFLKAFHVVDPPAIHHQLEIM